MDTTPQSGRHDDEHFALDVRTRLYVWLAGVFVTCLLMANVLGVKLFSFDTGLRWGEGTLKVEHTVGMLAFPITFVLTDLLNEYYGRRAARRVTWLAFAMGGLAFVLISIARQFPILAGVPGTATDESFENIFGASSLMYLASMIAFLAGSMLDIFVFGVFKRMTGGRLIWLRATGSTVISQVFDSLLVTWIFFQGLPLLIGVLSPSTSVRPADLAFVLSTAATGYVLKFVLAIALTPAIYAGRWLIRSRFGLTPLPARQEG